MLQDQQISSLAPGKTYTLTIIADALKAMKPPSPKHSGCPIPSHHHQPSPSSPGLRILDISVTCGSSSLLAKREARTPEGTFHLSPLPPGQCTPILETFHWVVGSSGSSCSLSTALQPKFSWLLPTEEPRMEGRRGGRKGIRSGLPGGDNVGEAWISSSLPPGFAVWTLKLGSHNPQGIESGFESRFT